MNGILKKIWLILAVRCDEASKLASDSLDRPLAWYESLAIRGHWISCWSCRHFHRQVVAIQQLVRRRSAAAAVDEDDSLVLDEAAKARFKSIVVEDNGA